MADHLLNDIYRLEWKWRNAERVLTIHADFAVAIYIARHFRDCDWCVRRLPVDVVLAQSKERPRWNMEETG